MTGMSLPRPRLRMEPAAEDASVTPIELFFDLVFVFALTQVTSLMAADLGDQGVLRGLLILALLWWSWVGYAWLCNVVRVDEGPVRLVLLLAMAAMFVLALAIPEAFDDRPGGLPGRSWWRCATSCSASCTWCCSGSSHVTIPGCGGNW